MPRLSLYRENRSNDYRFFDRLVREQLDVGGTAVNVHLYLGSGNVDSSNSVSNIQDLLFLENRDRKYDSSVYTLRGHYNISDIDFDLSQFGLFLQNDTIFIVFHINEMINVLGRKIISGDVLELPHLREFFPLDATIPAALRRYYVVQDATRASEGYSPTWWPHLWRIKAIPLVNGQEYQDLLRNLDQNDDGIPDGENGLSDLLTSYKKDLEINDAIIAAAQANVSGAGYDTTDLYTLATKENGLPSLSEFATADVTVATSDSTKLLTDAGIVSPKRSAYDGYLTGDGLAPNGHPVLPAIEFPTDAVEGDFVLRLDYKPNRLFRFDGRRWIKIEDNVRTSYLPSAGETLLGSFIQNTNQTTGADGRIFDQKQLLSQIVKPRADN